MPIMTICDFALGFQFEPKARGWMHSVISLDDLMMQFFSLQRQRTDYDPEHVGESLAAGWELGELLLTFNANGDTSSDGGEGP